MAVAAFAMASTSGTLLFRQFRWRGLVLQVGYRLKIRAYGELGQNVYPVAVPDVSGALVKRVDDVTTYGGGIELLLFRNLSVTANAYNTEYDSNVPEFDRSALRFTTSFVLGVPIP